jgi:hypothetical protein
MQFFTGNPNLQSVFLFWKKVMGVQSEVARASHGQLDAAKMKVSYFHCLPVLA